MVPGMITIGLGAHAVATKRTKTAIQRTTPKRNTDSASPPPVLLSLDPAIVSGWAIWLNGDLHSSGVAKTAEHRDKVVSDCWDLVAAEDFPGSCIFVAYEKTIFGPKGTVWGLGRACGKWFEHLELAKVPEKQIRSYTAGEWRRRVWGSKRMVGNKAQRRAGWKLWALTWVKTYYGVDAKTDDEAEAICIGEAWLLDDPLP